ncbi:MAG: PAS domain S-box protein [Ginsengibacter sp.]
MKDELQILILEDEVSDAELIKKFLERSGLKFNAIIASDKHEFVDAITKDKFDVILADNSLPQFNSVDALNLLKEQNDNTPFILVTGTVSEEFAVNILQQGADDYILKGNIKRLPIAISTAIDKLKIKKEKIAAEEALKQSELQYRMLFEEASDGIVIADKYGHVIDANARACKITGYEPGELLKLKIKDIFFEEDLVNESIRFAGLPEEKAPLSERKIKTKESLIIDVEVSAKMLPDERFQAFIRDISDRKKMELELKRSEVRFRALIENNDEAILLRDEQFSIIYCSPASKRILGYDDSETLENDFEITIHPDDREKMQNAKKELLKKPGITIPVTFRKKNKAGNYIQVEGVMTNMLHNENVKGIISNFRDVTERKKFEDQQALFVSIVNSSEDAIISKSLDGIITTWNKGAEKLFGYSSNEAIDRHVSMLIPADRLNEDPEILEKIKRGESVEHFETERLKKDKSRIYISITESPIKNLYGIIIGASKIARDITDRKEAEEKLQASYKNLRDLASHLQNIREEERIQIARDIHDELGQQLTGLKMDFAWLIKKIVVKDNTIQEKILEMITLIEETITSVRRISANLRPNILDDLGLVTALQWHSTEVEKRFGIKINFVSEFDVVEVPVATATGLFRIYQEALTNAVRHANAQHVNTTLQVVNKRIILQIQDDGKGMDIDNDLKKKSFGLLGIKERAYVMGGKYELSSEPGKGTHLLVSVPV